jgi:hypothetical protein
MSQSYVRSLLYNIAKEIKRPPESVESFIQMYYKNIKASQKIYNFVLV